MKIAINQKTLLESLEKGAVAAISDTAQEDSSIMSPIIKSIKITVGKEFTVESTTNLIAVKHSIPVTEGSGVDVKEEGCVLIPAKEFINWVKVQGEDAMITMCLSKLQTPEIINLLEDSGVVPNEDVEKYVIKKIGSVKLTSKDSTKTSGKWALDCYDPDQSKSINFSEGKEKCFDIQSRELKEGIDQVLFAALPKDYEHILDSVSIQIYKKNVYLATTDTKRCALYQVPKDAVASIESDTPLLITASLLELTSKISDKDKPMSFSYNSEKERVFVSQPNLKIRLASAQKDDIGKFPNIKMLLEKEYSPLAKVKKSSLNNILISAAIVNNSSALFSFDKDNAISIKAISEDNKYAPIMKKAGADKVSKNLQVVWGVSHLIEGLKILKADDVELSVPQNLKSVKITGKDQEAFSYFAMAIANPKYDADIEGK